MFFVYIAGSTLIFVFFLRHLLFGGKKLAMPDKFVLFYLGLFSLSVLFSSNWYTSLWGYYSRFNGGLISVLVFFGIYIVAKNFLTKKNLSVIQDASLITLLPISLYAIFQIGSASRVYSTLGQPNWLAAYLVFLMPLVVKRFIETKDKQKRVFWGATFLLAFAALWLTHSLSGLLGFIVGMSFLGFRMGRRLLSRRSLMFVSILLLFGLLNFSFFSQRISDALNFSDDPSSYNVSDPGTIRVGLWRGSWNMVTSGLKNFVVGIGPETFPYEFPFYRENSLNYSSEWDFILNKPHNYYLEILVESGFLALLAYLILVGKTVLTGEKFLSAGLLAFLVSNFFGWPTVSTSLLFWLWLAYAEKEKST